jgi:hypothetical protein
VTGPGAAWARPPAARFLLVGFAQAAVFHDHAAAMLLPFCVQPVKAICPIEALTSEEAAHFVGFYDICPWSPDGRLLAVQRCASSLGHMPTGREPAQICIWDPTSGSTRAVGETTTWNFQMGARVRWLKEGSICFNNLVDGTEGATIVSTEGRVLRTLPRAVGALSPDGQLAISPSFGRLGKYWPVYGYANLSPPGLEHPHPREDGLWVMDMERGTASLLISLDELSRDAGFSENAGQYVSHPVFSPSGNQCMFVHQAFTDRGFFLRLFVIGSDGTGLKLIADEMVSHPIWLDDATLFMWSRSVPQGLAALRRRGVFALPVLRPFLWLVRNLRQSFRTALLNEHFYTVPCEQPAQRRVTGEKLLTENGHPSLHPDKRVIVSDTYADKTGMLTLYLYDLYRNVRVDIARFRDGERTRIGTLSCHLHPRWDRSGEKVCVDTCENGVRQVCIVDARPGLALLQ